MRVIGFNSKPHPMNPLLGILHRVLSTLAFGLMIVALKLTEGRIPSGEVLFFRSFFALPPVVIAIWWQGQLGHGLKTERPGGHILRSLYGVTAMFLWFSAFQLLPYVDALAISYAAPLIMVVLAALILKERVRIYRWTAVAVGFTGVLVMLAPHLGDFGKGQPDTAALGALAAFLSSFFIAMAGIQVRALTKTESTGAIVVYFSIGCTLFSFLTLPFGWVVPSAHDLAALIATGLLGGVGQLFLTTSYRYADASTVAPIEYVSMIWAVLFGYFLFAEVPHASVLVGSAIVIGAGVFIVMRERALGIAEEKIRKPSPPAGT